MDGLEADFPQAATGLIPGVVEAVRTVRAARQTVEALRDPAASPLKAAYDSAYAVIAEGLTRDLGLPLLPLDTLRGTVPYVWGYPMGDVARVARTAPFDAALAIKVEVAFPGQTTQAWAVDGSGIARTRARPVVTVQVRLFDRHGQERWRDAVKVKPRETVELTEAWLLGLRVDRDVQATASLPDLVRHAVARLVRQNRDA